MASKTPRSQLVNPRLRYYRRYVIWGFLLDNQAMFAHKPKLSPEDEKDHMKVEASFDTYMLGLFGKYQFESWKIKGVETDRHQVASRVVYGGKSQGRNAIAIVQCTRREDSFIPSADKVEELKKYFAEHGHFEEPRWFVVQGD
ncbi:hypothetical protein BYT27DRAFT_7243512 [Phlegmacium glaucopus]|nr:hypothetical protein BYT27DRAFT_7243512 [Phlegmacium glaucopus]